MACRLAGTKPLSEPMLEYCQLDHWEQTSVKFKSQFNQFVGEIAFENVVCEVAAILSRPQCVNPAGVVVSFIGVFCLWKCDHT